MGLSLNILSNQTKAINYLVLLYTFGKIIVKEAKDENFNCN